MKTTLSNNLRYLRHFFDVTVGQMADVLNVSESHYRKIESKHNGITTDKLVILSRFFEISMEQLLDTKENTMANFIRSKDEMYEQSIRRKFKEASPPPPQREELKK